MTYEVIYLEDRDLHALDEEYHQHFINHHFPSHSIKQANQVIQHAWKDKFALDMDVLIERVRALYLRINDNLNNFPQKERQNLVLRTRNAYLETLKYLSLASTVKNMRKHYLQQAQGEFAYVRVLTALARESKYLSPKFFVLIDETQATIFNEIALSFRRLAVTSR